MWMGILRRVCRALFRVEVTGLAHIPAQDGMLIIANHESALDGLLLGLFIPKRAIFVVHEDSRRQVFFSIVFETHAAFVGKSCQPICHASGHTSLARRGKCGHFS